MCTEISSRGDIVKLVCLLHLLLSVSFQFSVIVWSGQNKKKNNFDFQVHILFGAPCRIGLQT